MLDTKTHETNKGIASEYIWDGSAADGSGLTMKDDPRIVMFDNFTDYDGNTGKHIKGGDQPKRWNGSGHLYFDWFNKFSGDYSLRVNIPQSSDAIGGGIQQWVDTNALKGLPMNDEKMTGKRGFIPQNPDKLPVYPEIKHREGGYTELYARAMVMYAENYDRYGHNSIGFSGGYNTAGYRSNGYDSFIAGVEPENKGILPVPGSLQIYYYGAEQVGKHGNHMYPSGVVNPATGGDNETWMYRYDGVNGFNALPDFVPPRGKWFSLEIYIKLNTVIKNGTSPGPNPPYDIPVGEYPLGPQPKPDDCEILKDGEIKVWVDGELILNYTDVVFRYSDTVIIDNFGMGIYSGNNKNPTTSVWWDNIVVATEYIGPVNTAGDDPWVTKAKESETQAVSIDSGASSGSTTVEVVDAVITQSIAYAEKGETIQYKADTDINALKYNKKSEYPLIPTQLMYNYSQVAKMPGNSSDGCNFDWGNVIKPERVITVYYDSPYSLEHTKKCLKAFVRNQRFIPWTNESWVKIRAWDSQNKYLQLFYGDFVDIFGGTTDFSEESVGEFTLALTVYNNEGDSVGEQPITVIKVEFGDIDVGLTENIYSAIWSVSDNKSTDTAINKNGLLTIGQNETAETLVVSVNSGSGGDILDKVKVTVLYADLQGINITSPYNTVDKGGTIQFSANVDIKSPLIYTTLCEFVNIHWRMPVRLENIITDSANMPLNGLWGHLFNLGTYIKPGNVLRVYYDSPYSREFTMDWLKIGVGFNSRSNLFNTTFDADNKYFDVSYDDFVVKFNSKDMSASIIGEQLLAIIIHNDNASGELLSNQRGSDGHKGPIKIKKVEFGKINAYTLVGIDKVTWSVSGNVNTDTIISPDGILSVASDEITEELTVICVSDYNTEIIDTAIIKIN